MTFRDFLRTLFERLRNLWQASFTSTGSDPALPDAPRVSSVTQADTPNSAAPIKPVRTLAADAGSFGGEVSISLSDRTEEVEDFGVSEADDVRSVGEAEGATVSGALPSGQENGDHVPAENATAEAAAAPIEDVHDDAEEGDDTSVMVQAPLEISAEDDPLPADIMVESYGRRMGLSQLIESLLFVSDEPVDSVQLAKALNVSLEAVEASVQRLARLYHLTGRGLRLQTREGRHSLVTTPECAGAIEDFLNLDLTTKLSGPALETLAVIAYRQPVTRIQIEAVRGVDCSGVLRSMTQRGLIEEVGRLETVGRPILYGVTDLFMQHFGLLDLNELPPLATEDEDMLWAATQLAELEGEAGASEALDDPAVEVEAEATAEQADAASDSATDTPDPATSLEDVSGQP